MNKSTEDICVLIVEDQVGMRKIIKTVIHSLGISSVLEAGDGAEALQLLAYVNKHVRNERNPQAEQLTRQRKHIDFVVCDWRMPKLSGLELLKTVRQDEKLKDIPFMMLTAENTEEQVTLAAEWGIVDYIVKPFSAQVLEAKLKSALSLET